MTDKILFIDDDTNLLAAVQRNLRLKFNLVTADGGEAGLAKLAAEGPFAVIVADMQMPGMDGVQVLTAARARCPDTVRIMLTGNADQRTAAEAINIGHIFLFLSKPCPIETLSQALQTGLKQYELITAERDLLEKTLNGCVKMLTNILSLADPLAFGRGETLRNYMRSYIHSTQLGKPWEFEIAAMLCKVGKVTVPPAVLEKARAQLPLTAAEQEVMIRLPKAGADLLASIPRLELISRIILYHQKHYDGSGFPEDEIRGEEIPIAARILKVLTDLLELETQYMPKEAALKLMQQRTGWYDPRVLDATFACFDIYLPARSAQSQGRAITARELRVGQTVMANVQTENGKVVVLARSRITPVLLTRLANFDRFSPIQEPIYIEYDSPPEKV